MKEMISTAFVAYALIAVIALPAILGTMLIMARDCRLLSGQECFWELVPVEETRHD